MADDARTPTNLNTGVPHPARVYDFWLGGKDNFAADRELATKLLAAQPGTLESVRANRAFLKRAVEFAGAAGIRQFIDIGSGLPTAENTHEIAQRTTPGARVVYVDNDPIVRAHGQALLAETGSTIVAQADLREPEAILTHPDIERLVDFDQPVAVLLLGVLHFIPEPQDLEILDRLRAAMAPESHLIVPHLTADSDPEGIGRFVDVLRNSPSASVSIPRTREQVGRFFDGFELLDPGIVPVDRWRPDTPRPADAPFWLWAGVGRKN
jgi:CheY-like chemotaxis protein